MARIRNIQIDVTDPKSMAEAIQELQRVVGGLLDVGEPQNPYDESNTTDLAGDIVGPPAAGRPVHNGTPGNLLGSWVEVEIAAANAAVAFNHNLDLPVVGTDEPNVRILSQTLRHSGAGAAPGPLSLEYDDSLCTVGANTIELVLRAGGTRTIAAGANAVKASVCFVPATRWI